MPIVTDRQQTLDILSRFQSKKVSMALFCTASHWNTEAILAAADNIGKKYGISDVPVSVAMTYNYPYMPQAQRVTRCKDSVAGFISIMEHLKALAPVYENVAILPHLDHADPSRDNWALTEGLPWLASVMFDAQKYPFEDNLRMTSEYVAKYGNDVVIEGIMDQLAVSGQTRDASTGTYEERAEKYIGRTRIDLLVADLGTEQQSTSAGNCVYLGDRARNITERIGKPILVLHGTSSLSDSEMSALAGDGVVRVNMWTRIVREAGQYAAEKLVERIGAVRAGDFEATESRQYIMDNIEKSVEIMEETMFRLGYARLV